MAIKNGTAFKISVGGAVVDDLTTVGESVTMETREITTKDSSGNRELAEGKLSETYNFEGLYDGSSTTNYDVLKASMKTRASVAVVVNPTAGGGVAPEEYYSSSAFITQLSRTGGFEDNVTFSGTLEVTGAVTPTTIT